MIDYNKKLSNEGKENTGCIPKNVYHCTALQKYLSVSFMLFYDQYLATTGN